MHFLEQILTHLFIVIFFTFDTLKSLPINILLTPNMMNFGLLHRKKIHQLRWVVQMLSPQVGTKFDVADPPMESCNLGHTWLCRCRSVKWLRGSCLISGRSKRLVEHWLLWKLTKYLFKKRRTPEASPVIPCYKNIKSSTNTAACKILVVFDMNFLATSE